MDPMNRCTVRRAAALVLLMLLPAGARAQDVRVAAASDLQATLPVLVARFEKRTGRGVSVTYGSSGNFFAQIQNGAPFDVYLSADVDYPRRLEQQGLTAPGTVRQYAVGRLVLWTRKDSGIDLRRGLDVLPTPAVRTIALANPDHAPYGRAAVAALRAARIYERVRERFVFGENISQAAQFAQSGNADVGIIAMSLAVGGAALRNSGTFVEIPASLHPPIEQGAAVLQAARNPAAARQFLDFLIATDSVTYLRQWGFEGPSAKRGSPVGR
jgi:molybdate transport system substrate-binding protein